MSAVAPEAEFRAIAQTLILDSLDRAMAGGGDERFAEVRSGIAEVLRAGPPYEFEAPRLRIRDRGGRRWFKVLYRFSETSASMTLS